MSDNIEAESDSSSNNVFQDYIESTVGGARFDEAFTEGIRTPEQETELSGLLDKDPRGDPNSFYRYLNSPAGRNSFDSAEHIGILNEDQEKEITPGLELLWEEFLGQQASNITKSKSYLQMISTIESYDDFDSSKLLDNGEYRSSFAGFNELRSAIYYYLETTIPGFMKENGTSLDNVDAKRDFILQKACTQFDSLLVQIIKPLIEDGSINFPMNSTKYIWANGIVRLRMNIPSDIEINFYRRFVGFDLTPKFNELIKGEPQRNE